MVSQNGPVTADDIMNSTVCILGDTTWLVDDKWAEAVEKVLNEFMKNGVARRVGRVTLPLAQAMMASPADELPAV